MSAASAEPRAGDRVAAYYDEKIPSVLRKYGPGPRVHFHSGFLDRAPTPPVPPEGLQPLLHEAQEEVLRTAAAFWEAERFLTGEVLDVGCGVGGGSLFWASEYGATVTALTHVPRQAECVAAFAGQAGLRNRIGTLIQDAHDDLPPARYDAAVAIESSCYFDPDRWFAVLYEGLRPGGRVYVIDTFERTPGGGRLFDERYHCQIRPFADVASIARRRGFSLIAADRLCRRVPGFWEASAQWYEVLAARVTTSEEAAAARESADVHRAFGEAYASGAVEYRMAAFIRQARRGR